MRFVILGSILCGTGIQDTAAHLLPRLKPPSHIATGAGVLEYIISKFEQCYEFDLSEILELGIFKNSSPGSLQNRQQSRHIICFK